MWPYFMHQTRSNIRPMIPFSIKYLRIGNIKNVEEVSNYVLVCTVTYCTRDQIWKGGIQKLIANGGKKNGTNAAFAYKSSITWPICLKFLPKLVPNKLVPKNW